MHIDLDKYTVTMTFNDPKIDQLLPYSYIKYTDDTYWRE